MEMSTIPVRLTVFPVISISILSGNSAGLNLKCNVITMFDYTFSGVMSVLVQQYFPNLITSLSVVFVVWLMILLFGAFPVSGFCAGWYILINPFTVCIDGLTVLK